MMVSPIYQNSDFSSHDELFSAQTYVVDVELSTTSILESEKSAFEQMKNDLLQDSKFSGKFIAIHNGNVVDFDSDQIDLLKRLDQSYGKYPVLIEKLDEPLIFTSSPSFDIS